MSVELPGLPGLPGTVLVVGCGLLGTSVGMALRRRGVDVLLADTDPRAVAVAASMGAGRPAADAEETTALAVVAVPPSATAGVVVDLLRRERVGWVCDVASVKSALAAEVVAACPSRAGRYVGSHPMAGREVGGAQSARGDLFEGRPWVLCPHPATDPRAVAVVRAVAVACGALPVEMPPEEHDTAVALVSHGPHLLAALVAGQLAEAPEREVALAGPGVTDVTRVAAGDPRLWTEILTANAAAVRPVLTALRADLEQAIAALSAVAEPAADGPDALVRLLAAGVAGRSRLPGKHGAPPTEFATLLVVVDDRPGQLARLFADAGEAGVNVEDVRIDHSPGQPVGTVEVAVRPGRQGGLARTLRAHGWVVHE